MEKIYRTCQGIAVSQGVASFDVAQYEEGGDHSKDCALLFKMIWQSLFLIGIFFFF